MTKRPDHGRQIAAARAALGMTRKQIADVASLHPNSIINAERRDALPRYSLTGDRIAEALEPMGVTFETRGDEFAVVIRPGATA